MTHYPTTIPDSQRSKVTHPGVSPSRLFDLEKVTADSSFCKETSKKSTMATKYTVVMIRHGESRWNQENRFCGWHDADLSETGIAEATNSGKVSNSAADVPRNFCQKVIHSFTGMAVSVSACFSHIYQDPFLKFACSRRKNTHFIVICYEHKLYVVTNKFALSAYPPT